MIIFYNILREQPEKPFPIGQCYHRYDQKRKNDTPITDNCAKVVYAETDRQQDSEREKKTEVHEILRCNSIFMKKEKENE